MNCHQCGTALQDTDRFCPQCGENVEHGVDTDHGVAASPTLPEPVGTPSLDPRGLPGVTLVSNADDYIGSDDWECGGREVGMARAFGQIHNPDTINAAFLICVGLFDEQGTRVGGLVAIAPTVGPGETAEWSTPTSSLVDYDSFETGAIEAVASLQSKEAGPLPRSVLPGVAPIANPDDAIHDDDWECVGRDVGMARASGLVRNTVANESGLAHPDRALRRRRKPCRRTRSDCRQRRCWRNRGSGARHLPPWCATKTSTRRRLKRSLPSIRRSRPFDPHRHPQPHPVRLSGHRDRRET